MKRVILSIAAFMLFSSTAFGAPTDGTSSWIMTIPAQTVSVYCVQWINIATKTVMFTTLYFGTNQKTFDLIISGGGMAVQFAETNNPTPNPDLAGTGTISGDGPYTVTTNATTGSFVPFFLVQQLL